MKPAVARGDGEIVGLFRMGRAVDDADGHDPDPEAGMLSTSKPSSLARAGLDRSLWANATTLHGRGRRMRPSSVFCRIHGEIDGRRLAGAARQSEAAKSRRTAEIN